MLDIKFIRENKKAIEEAAKNKNVKVDIDQLLKLNGKRRELLIQVDELRAKRNELAKESKGGKPTLEQINIGKELKEKITTIEKELKTVDADYQSTLITVPNLISDDTPIGPDESGNKVIRKYKEPTKFDFESKDHMQLSEALGIIDTEKSANISGSRFNYLFGEAVMLQFALLQFVFATLTDKKIIKKLADKVGNPSDKPFVPVVPPVMAKSEIMKKMDRFDPIDDRYYLEEDDVLLVGSAEHTLGPLHMNEIIDEKDLPIRYIGYSTAFRREAGSYGKDTAGILRCHQFDKAEMETFVQPEYGQKEQDLIVAIQEYLIRQLELPHQIVAICSGDMGKPDFRQIDIECWMPGQNKYRETNTSDYMTDFQARRLNIRYRKKDGGKEMIHMNDATAFAMGRMLIAILENYQQADGSILIPEVLKKYMPGDITKIEVKK
ncbi:MAG: serine--tRNA ligase [Patescibacteria group bacterium]|nr:serine--tRNA ligase [Patescibacteria group bacterium]